MRDSDIQAASDFLTTLWCEGRHAAGMPVALRPATRAQAYAVQARVEKLSSWPLAGWKIAATSLAGQKHINVSGPMAGRLLAERIVPEGQTVRLGANRMLVAEVEFVFRMGSALPPRAMPYEQAVVVAAVEALYLGIERRIPATSRSSKRAKSRSSPTNAAPTSSCWVQRSMQTGAVPTSPHMRFEG